LAVRAGGGGSGRCRRGLRKRKRKRKKKKKKNKKEEEEGSERGEMKKWETGKRRPEGTGTSLTFLQARVQAKTGEAMSLRAATGLPLR
jgi:hypothetical protein